MDKFALPFVSVIVPFLNVKDFLPETISSVCLQQYTNWEMILIDDGSSDGSTEIAKRYAEENPGKIIYLEHEGHINRGAAASRNLGASKARGELLAFLDSDDFWLPQKLKEQVELLQKNPDASVVCEAITYWYSWHHAESKDLFFPIGAEAEKVHIPPSLAYTLYPLGKGHSFCTCGLIMKAKSFEAIGGFDESFTGKNQLYEDQVLYMKIYLHEKVYISSRSNNLYRQRSNSLMHGLMSEGYYMQGRHYFLQWLIGYLEQKSIHNEKLQKLIKRALWPYRYPRLFRLKEMPIKFMDKVKSVYENRIKW